MNQQTVSRPVKRGIETTNEESDASKRQKFVDAPSQVDTQNASTLDSFEETNPIEEQDRQRNSDSDEAMDITTLLQTNFFSHGEYQEGVSDTTPHQPDQHDEGVSTEDRRGETATIPQSNHVWGLQSDQLRAALQLIEQNPELLSQTIVDPALAESTVSQLNFLHQVFHDAEVTTTALLQYYNNTISSTTTNHETTVQEHPLLQPNEDLEQNTTDHDDHSGEEIDQLLSSPSPSPSSSIFEEAAENHSSVPLSTEVMLSRVLQRSFDHMEESVSVELKIEEQPSLFRKRRTLNSLQKGDCSIVQADKTAEIARRTKKNAQRHPVATFSAVTPAEIPEHVLLIIQLLDYYDQPHRYKMILSPEANIPESVSNRSKNEGIKCTWKDVEMDKGYGDDKENCALLRELSGKEKSSGKFDIQFKIANKYKGMESNQKKSSTSQSSSSEETDYISKKFCKFKLCLCQLNSSKKLVRISNYATSVIIEDGVRHLQVKNVLPNYLSPDGRDEIKIQFNTPIAKAGFDILVNNRKLESNEFRVRSSDTIVFQSIKQSEETEDGIQLAVIKKNFLETSNQNELIEQTFKDKELWRGVIQYFPTDFDLFSDFPDLFS